MNQTHFTKLDNGLRVLTHRIEGFSSTVLGYWVEAGGTCETPDICGVSHFLEHMAFKGTASRTAKQIAEEIESVGGYTNAYTSKEVTAFHAKVLGKDTALAVDILSDILQNPTFEDAELERERGVILQEIAQSIDTPDDIIFDHFQRVAFKNQSLGRPILGPIDVVSRISAEDLRRYRAKYYNADNIVFSAVGNVEHAQLLDLAKKYFEKFSTNSTDCTEEKFQYTSGFYSDERDIEQTHVIIGFEGLASTDKDYYTLAIFSSILGGGMSSKLFQEVREKRGLVYSIYTLSSSYKSNGIFGVYAATSADKVKELTKVVLNEIQKMKFDIEEKEFNRTKAQFEAGLLMARENNYTLCEQIVNQTMIFGRSFTNDEIMQKINAVTIDDVKKMTDRILSSSVSIVTVGKFNVSHLMPILDQSGVRYIAS